jgi:hypothetical protein
LPPRVQRRQMGANKRKKWKFWENKTKITDFGRIRTYWFKFIAEENYTRFCKLLHLFFLKKEISSKAVRNAFYEENGRIC